MWKLAATFAAAGGIYGVAAGVGMVVGEALAKRYVAEWLDKLMEKETEK